MHRADHLAVNLRFEAQPRDGDGKPMQATCFYRYDAVEDTALILADPLAAYATSPYGMTLNGKAIGNPLLAEGIGRAMLKQGRALLERAQQGIDAATQQILHREQDVPSR
ncbi:hypothetical protein [uncultured Thiocystis sp.]|uniref:hypothetical protein n=1 Tax=uncultured Thiocystis sp. TaxID=1202134 RepID=UPI0025DF1B94|nr:hypothetical protein [uncultured Thiocystis sp.]